MLKRFVIKLVLLEFDRVDLDKQSRVFLVAGHRIHLIAQRFDALFNTVRFVFEFRRLGLFFFVLLFQFSQLFFELAELLFLRAVPAFRCVQSRSHAANVLL